MKNWRATYRAKRGTKRTLTHLLVWKFHERHWTDLRQIWKDGVGTSLWKEAVKVRNLLNIKILKDVTN
jgi:hypothetical protein